MIISVTIKIHYAENSVKSEDDIIQELEREVGRAVGNGMLTGATDAIVNYYDVTVKS